MKVSDYIINFLQDNDACHVFQLIGGAIAHLVDSTIDNKGVMCVTLHHEQGAAFAAEGYARCNGKIGVAMATSGPGATNLITGIASCYFDSVPCVFITGQVNTYEYKFDLPIRQLGFQETDIVKIIQPVTKGAKLVESPESIRADLEWAVSLAQSGRPGPVLLDIPMNVQRADIDANNMRSYCVDKSKPDDEALTAQQLDSILSVITSSSRPVLLVGGGVRAAKAADDVRKFVTHTKIPVVASLMGIDAVCHQDSYIGFIGAYGNRYANLTIANADLVIVLGSRLDTRQTGTQPATFAREAKIIHIDIDDNELNRVLKTDIAVKQHLHDFMTALNKQLQSTPLHDYKVPAAWLNKINNYKSSFPSFPIVKSDVEIDPNEFLFQLSQKVSSDSIIVVDVGQHQMWAAQSFFVQKQQRFLTSGGMGAMGFALPAAIGAALAEPARDIIVIVGDGALQVNIQELETVVRNQMNIKIIVMNNSSLGMVRQFQQVYFSNRLQATVDGYSCPDFTKIAKAYDIHAVELSQKQAVAETLNNFLAEKGPALINVMLPQLSRVEPKLIVNEPVENQDPKLPRNELQKLMLVPLLDNESSK